MWKWISAVAACSAFVWMSAPGTAAAERDLDQVINTFLEEHRDELIEVRRDLHRHPEVSGQEVRTSGVVAKRLEAIGLDVSTGVGGHGVVGRLEGASPGPTIAFRADMDAVPFSAPDPVEFASVNEGVRHICGHDVHTTIGLALAEALSKVKDEIAGSVVFYFQPAEENGTGAEAMLADGIFGEAKPDALFAVHTAPLEVGTLATMKGRMMAGRDLLTLTSPGSGDAAKTAIDEVVSAVRKLTTLSMAQGMLPTNQEFVMVQMRSGTQTDDGYSARGFLTTSGDTTSEAMRAEVEKIVAAKGLEIEWSYEIAKLAGVVNDEAVTQRAIESVRSLLGGESVVELTTIIPAFSEDFGSFQRQVPGTFFFLGVANSAKGISGMPHSPDYVADEESIFVGTKAMARVILDALEEEAGP